jgi:hypothetical protein
MTLATLHRSVSVPPSPGQSRVQEAARLLQAALLELRREERERAERQKNFKVRPYSEREQALINKAEARRIKQAHLLSVSRAWFWDFCGQMLDIAREAAAEARKRGEQSRAASIDARIDAACERVDRLQQREAAR